MDKYGGLGTLNLATDHASGNTDKFQTAFLIS
jgi:hypothetical protein